jgi:alkylated DNA repair dioxygenase AlkB
MSQTELFEATELPPGFRYRAELIDRAEEERLIDEFARFEFKPFEFHGFVGKRKTVSFGWRYDFNGSGLQKSGEIPAFLLPVRNSAAEFAGMRPDDLQHALLTEYAAGATIGWHKDRSVFGEVIGVSLLSACTFRLRRKQGGKWLRRSLVAEPRSAYLLSGPARTEWEHSIPALDQLRYSITFRALKEERLEKLA